MSISKTTDALNRQLKLSKKTPGRDFIAAVRLLPASTIDKYRIRPQKPPSQTWRAFLDNHVKDIVSVDFFAVPTVTFRVLFCFIVLRHDRRRVVHFNVTAHPTDEWAAQQVGPVAIRSVNGERLVSVRQFELTNGKQMVVFTELSDEEQRPEIVRAGSTAQYF